MWGSVLPVVGHRSGPLQKSQDHISVVIQNAALFFAAEGSQSPPTAARQLILSERKLPKHGPPTTADNLSARKSHAKLQNSVDTSFIVPQYLVSERPPVLFIGLVFQATGPGVQSRKGNLQRRILQWQRRRRQKRKSTNRQRDLVSHRQDFHWPLRRSTS